MRPIQDFAFACLLAVLCGGCVRYQDQPLSPAGSAAAFDSRSLGDLQLKEFLEQQQAREFTTWPMPAWDFPLLTFAAFYFHPSLEVARAQWNVAKAGIRTAGGRPNPTLSVTPEYAFNAEPGMSPWLATLNLSVPIETAGKRGYRIAGAQQMAEAARLNLASMAWQVRSNVRGSLLDFSVLRRRAAFLQDLFDAQQQLVTLLEQRLQAGAIAPTEITPARVALLKSTADLVEARRQAAEARGRLAEALGLPLKALERVEFQFDLSSATGALGQLTAADLRPQALQGRPDIRAALAEYAASQSALQLEIARQYPDIHLGTGYQFDQGTHKWALGLTAELPVLNRNEGPIAEALARRAEAAARFLALQAKVVAEIDRAFELQLAAQEQLRSSESLVRTQRAYLDALQASFQAGGADAVEVNGARLELSVGLLARLDAEFKSQQALGQLEEALRLPFDGLAAVERGHGARAMKENP